MGVLVSLSCGTYCCVLSKMCGYVSQACRLTFLWFVINCNDEHMINLFFEIQNFKMWMCGSVGRASDSRPEGHRFKSGHVQYTFWTSQPFLKLCLATLT